MCLKVVDTVCEETHTHHKIPVSANSVSQAQNEEGEVYGWTNEHG